MHGFWVASLQVWPRWALTVIRFVENYFTCVKDPKNSGQSLVAALQSRPPLTLTINTIRDYVSMYMQLFTPLYVTSHHYDICTFVRRYEGKCYLVPSYLRIHINTFVRRYEGTHPRRHEGNIYSFLSVQGASLVAVTERTGTSGSR